MAVRVVGASGDIDGAVAVGRVFVAFDHVARDVVGELVLRVAQQHAEHVVLHILRGEEDSRIAASSGGQVHIRIGRGVAVVDDLAEFVYIVSCKVGPDVLGNVPYGRRQGELFQC